MDFALANDNARILCATVDFDLSIRVQQRKIKEFLPQHETMYSKYDEVRGFVHNQIVLKNGAKIFFKTYDQDVDSYQGDDLDLIWWDEEPPYAHYTEGKIRLIDRGGRMFFTMTPVNGVTNLVNELLENDDIAKHYLNTYSNPHISKTDVDLIMQGLDEVDREVRCTGKAINKAGLVYPIFNKDIHVVNRNFEKDCLIYNVLDPHDRKPWAMGWYAVDRTGDVYCFREWPNEPFEKIKSDSRTVEEYANMIHKIEQEMGLPIYRRMIDPNFGNRVYRQHNVTINLRDMLNRYSLFYDFAIDDVHVGHQKVREYLNYNKEQPIGPTNRPKFYISKDCRNHWYFMSNYCWDDYKKAEDRDVKQRAKDKYKDFSDLCRYLLMEDPRGYVPSRGQYHYKVS